MFNEISSHSKATDAAAVGARIREASERLHSLLWRYSLFDACIVCAWTAIAVSSLVSPNDSFALRGMSRFSIATLCILCAAAPCATSCARIIAVLTTRNDVLRVDCMCGAPTTLRQVAHTSYHRQIGWWHWLGYYAVPVYVIVNVVISFAWLLIFGFHFFIVALVLVATGTSAFVCVTYTSKLYRIGIANFNLSMTTTELNQWARFRASSHADSWNEKRKTSRKR